MIPKVIHYCWFGKNEKSKLIKKCIESWKKYCPEYEIIEWNEENFDVNCNKYTKQAYENKKWAFVSDYARLWILYNYGGIYLDTDVELIKSLDSTLECDAFFASENNKSVSTGLGCGSVKGNKLIKKMLDEYNSICFIDKNGKMDLTTCVVRNSKSIESDLKKIKNMNVKNVTKNFTYYPFEYFCPYDNFNKKLNITDKCIGIHWFNDSWNSRSNKIKTNILISIKKILGEKSYNKIKEYIKK